MAVPSQSINHGGRRRETWLGTREGTVGNGPAGEGLRIRISNPRPPTNEVSGFFTPDEVGAYAQSFFSPIIDKDWVGISNRILHSFRVSIYLFCDDANQARKI